jgi:hypothetical protein
MSKAGVIGPDGKLRPEYEIWRGMRRRCYEPKNKGYQRYGKRGIRVCDRWLGRNGFENFFKDMGPRPSTKHSVDRHPNNNGNYAPDNCRWATQQEQMRNTRVNFYIEYAGKRLLAIDWEKIVGIKWRTIRYRIQNLGYSPEKALTTPRGDRSHLRGCAGQTRKFFTYKRKTQSLVAWCDELNLKYSRLEYLLRKRKLPFADAVKKLQQAGTSRLKRAVKHTVVYAGNRVSIPELSKILHVKSNVLHYHLTIAKRTLPETLDCLGLPQP